MLAMAGAAVETYDDLAAGDLAAYDVAYQDDLSDLIRGGVLPAYVSGFPDGTFRANNSATRAEVASMLYRLLDTVGGRRPVTTTPNFTDVSDNAWYARAVNTLASMEIIVGYPDGTFRPNQPITRAEVTTLLVKFLNAPQMSSTNIFSDLAETHWAYSFIMQAHANGWVAGYPDGTFRPDVNIIRAEVVTIINNATSRSSYKEWLRFEADFPDVDDSHWAYSNIILAAEDIIWYREATGE